MKLGVRVLAVCGLAVIFSQASAKAQFSARPFGNGNEWHYRSQQAARGEITKPELYRWMNEGQPPRGTVVPMPRGVTPIYSPRRGYPTRPVILQYKPTPVPGTINYAPPNRRK